MLIMYCANIKDAYSQNRALILTHSPRIVDVFTNEDFELVNYDPHLHIKAPVAV